MATQLGMQEMELYKKPGTPMDLLSIALHNNAAIDVIERLAALQEKTLARQAEIEFNEALNRVQQQIKRIVPDLENPQKHSKYASYAAIDRVIRPIYSQEGISLSFTHADCPKPDHIRVICRCALRGHKELYQVDWPVDTKGPKGEPVMTATQATGASDSYAKRYLVKDIFNIAIGEGDTDGNINNGWLADRIKEIKDCRDQNYLGEIFNKAYAEAKKERNAQAILILIEARDEQRKKLG